jgi:LacI family transcriptional regulator
MPTNPSLRQLARTLGLSHTTVSEALRGCERVHPKTRQRVVAAAEQAGYTYNPLAGALMSEMRRSRTGTFRGGLALLDVDGPTHRDEPGNRFHSDLIKGATERAAELGFKADLFAMGEGTRISLPRLDQILQSRGIRGIFLLPVTASPELMGLDWSRYAGVYPTTPSRSRPSTPFAPITIAPCCWFWSASTPSATNVPVWSCANPTTSD